MGFVSGFLAYVSLQTSFVLLIFSVTALTSLGILFGVCALQVCLIALVLPF